MQGLHELASSYYGHATKGNNKNNNNDYSYCNELVFIAVLKEEAEAVSKRSEFHTDMALGKKECKNCDE